MQTISSRNPRSGSELPLAWQAFPHHRTGPDPVIPWITTGLEALPGVGSTSYDGPDPCQGPRSGETLFSCNKEDRELKVGV